MNPIVNNNLLVPIHADRAGAENIACGLFDVNTGKYMHGQLLSNEAIKIKDSIKSFKGTIVYIHNKYNVYGIVRDAKKAPKPTLCWLSGDEVELIKHELLNYNERLNIVDISDEPIEIFKGRFKSDVFSTTRITDSKMGIPISYENFIETISKVDKPAPVVQGGQSSIVVDTTENVEKVEKVEETLVKDTESPIETVSESVAENSEINLDNVENHCDNSKPAVVKKDKQMKSNSEVDQEYLKLAKILMDATNALNDTRKELQKTTESYKETMAKSFGEFDLDVEAKFVGVNDIKGDLADTEESNSDCSNIGTDAVYELILKLMKVDDSISLPRTYYEKLSTIIKRNMMLSRDGSKYDSIILIRFNKMSKENIIARVEYDLTKDYTRVTVIKQYNAVELTDNQLLDYEIKFNQWRRMHSYRTSE